MGGYYLAAKIGMSYLLNSSITGVPTDPGFESSRNRADAGFWTQNSAFIYIAFGLIAAVILGCSLRHGYLRYGPQTKALVSQFPKESEHVENPLPQVETPDTRQKPDAQLESPESRREKRKKR